VLPRTRRWDDVVDLVAGGADIPQVASAAARAAHAFFAEAADSAGFVTATWLLAQLPLAARRDSEYLGGLQALGLDLKEAPGVLGLAGAFSDAVDSQTRREGDRTDAGDIARLAATETLTAALGQRTRSLFGTTAEDVRRELARVATVAQFGSLYRDFFARFTRRALTFFLSRELSNHVGGERRFADLAAHSAFNAALELHCREAARIVEASRKS
jgi:hypothetical protein